MKSNGFSEAPARRAPDVFSHLIERLCPAYRNRITAELRPEEKDGFQLADAPGGRIRISGNTPVSLAAGLNYYLRERAGVHLSWCGDRLALPPEPPPVSTEVRREFPLPLRPCLNYCTFGYSMVWWEWPRWEREIDFMALNGINMPLAVTGIEAIYLRTLLHFGLSREEILAFLSGPAFLPWQYMNNLDSHAGPLPSPWITSHLALGRRILERERAWGMKPILPGFSGHVPEAFARLYPRCRFIRSEGWCGFAPVVTIDPADPMFAEVNAVFLRELTGAFGTDHYYSIDLFHEQRLDRCSPDHLAACGRSVSAALLAADPEAVWVMQAWSERPEIIRNIPAGRLLLLDIGKERLKATGGLDGRPVVWGTIHSFGGQTEIGGDLAAIPREIAEQRRRFPKASAIIRCCSNWFSTPPSAAASLIWSNGCGDISDGATAANPPRRFRPGASCSGTSTRNGAGTRSLPHARRCGPTGPTPGPASIRTTCRCTFSRPGRSCSRPPRLWAARTATGST